MELKNVDYSNKNKCTTTFSNTDVLICGDKSSSVCKTDVISFRDRVWISPKDFPLQSFQNFIKCCRFVPRPSPDIVKDFRVPTMCA